MQNDKLPIGYWIKQADELLTKGIDDIQSSLNIKRTEWQILSSANKKSISREELLTIMTPFADKQMVNSIIAKFKAEEVLDIKEQRLYLTDKGKELYEACLERQQSFRQQAMATISEQDYETTILTLQRIVHNISS